MDQQLQLHSGTSTQQREEGFVSDFTEACPVLFCTMEMLVSVPAVEAVKDEVKSDTNYLSIGV